MQAIIDFITAHGPDILAAIGAVVTAATASVALTPSTRDDEILGKIVKALELLSIVNKRTKE